MPQILLKPQGLKTHSHSKAMTSKCRVSYNENVLVQLKVMHFHCIDRSYYSVVAVEKFSLLVASQSVLLIK